MGRKHGRGLKVIANAIPTRETTGCCQFCIRKRPIVRRVLSVSNTQEVKRPRSLQREWDHQVTIYSHDRSSNSSGGESSNIDTGLDITIPEGYFGMLLPDPFHWRTTAWSSARKRFMPDAMPTLG